MIEDPIVEEVRKYRQEHSHFYGYDLQRIVKSLREREQQSKRLILNPGPKYLKTLNPPHPRPQTRSIPDQSQSR